MGPWPRTRTVSPGATRALRTAFRHVFTGSTNVASSNVTSGGKAIIPRSTIHGIARTYSAKPPPLGSKPAVKPDFLVSRALREEFALAVEAAAARNVVEADDAIAGLELRYAAADLHDGARKLVPQNLRRLNESVVNLLDVRSANAACRHAEQDFALANLRNRHGFDDHAALAAVDARAHMPRMLPLGFVRPDLCGCMAHWPAVAAFVSRVLARSTSIGT